MFRTQRAPIIMVEPWRVARCTRTHTHTPARQPAARPTARPTGAQGPGRRGGTAGQGQRLCGRIGPAGSQQAPSSPRSPRACRARKDLRRGAQVGWVGGHTGNARDAAGWLAGCCTAGAAAGQDRAAAGQDRASVLAAAPCRQHVSLRVWGRVGWAGSTLSAWLRRGGLDCGAEAIGCKWEREWYYTCKTVRRAGRVQRPWCRCV